jgi:hypothetical protein
VGVEYHRVVSIEPDGMADVYQIAVANTHTYALTNGLISGNSQMEVRGFVLEAGDEDLRQVFVQGKNHPSGGDPHRFMAHKSFRVPMDKVTDAQRRSAKSVTFGILYNRGAKAIALQLGISEVEAQKIIDDFLNSAPKVKDWQNAQKKFARKYQCSVTMLGWVRDLTRELQLNDGGHHAESCGVNTPIQSLCGVLANNSLAHVSYALEAGGYQTTPIIAVHDSVVLDLAVPEILDVLHRVPLEMRDRMPERFPFVNLPMDIDMEVGVDWKHLVKVSAHDSVVALDGGLVDVGRVVDRLGRVWTFGSPYTVTYNGKSEEPCVKISLQLQQRKQSTAPPAAPMVR